MTATASEQTGALRTADPVTIVGAPLEQDNS